MTQVMPDGEASLAEAALTKVVPVKVALYPLTYVEDNDQVIVGRPEIDAFAVFPPDAAEALRHLEAGEEPAAVAAWYEQTYGESVDIGDFLETLRDLEFLRPGEAPAAEVTVAAPVRWQRLGAAAFSPVALALYVLAVAAAIYLMVRTPALQPYPSRVFFSRSVLLVVAGVAVAQLAGIAWHEGFHVLAGRRLGLPSRLSLGRRLYFLVFQTTLVGLMGVKPRKRILPFCAGLIADALFISVLTGFGELSRVEGWPSWVLKAAVAFAYVTILRMIWQAMIYMETDLYYVLSSALRCPDLHQMSQEYLRSRTARLFRRPRAELDDTGWSERDHLIVRRYAPCVVVGSFVIICVGMAGSIPVLAGFVYRTYHTIATGTLGSPWFWDSTIFALAMLAQFSFVAVIAVRDHRRRVSATRGVPTS